MIQGDSFSDVDSDPGPQMDCEGCVGISNAFCVANDDVSAFTARINSRRRLRKRYNRLKAFRYPTPSQCHKSADFFPLVSFYGTPSSVSMI